MTLLPSVGWRLPTSLAGAAERHALIEQTVVADLGRLADHDPGAVVNDQTAADLRAGVYFQFRSTFSTTARSRAR